MRGLDWVLQEWEKKISPEIPDSRIELYTGSQTYGKFGLKHKEKIESILTYAKSLKRKGVLLKGPVSKNILFRNLKNSRVLIYRGTDDETFCMAVAEAQTHGVPVVVCNFGSLSERVQNDKTGFVCENEGDFSIKTIKLLKDDKTWMRMHKNLIKNNNHDDWSEVAKKWQKIID